MNTTPQGSRPALVALTLAVLVLSAASTRGDAVKDFELWLNPYEVGSSVIVPVGQYQSELSFSVPAGYRAVTEHVSIFLSVQEGNSASCVLYAGLTPAASVVKQQHTLVLQAQGPDGVRPGQVVLHASQPLRMTADHYASEQMKDLQVFCTFAQPSAPAIPIIFRASISGRLVKP